MSNVDINHAFVSAKPDGADATRIRASNWNAKLLFSAGALGDLLYRDTGSATGASYLPDVAVGSVLVSGGVGAAPAWSAAPTFGGQIKLADGTLAAPGIAFASQPGSGFYLISGDGNFTATAQGAQIVRFSGAPGFDFGSNAYIRFGATAAVNSTMDTWIKRAAAGVVDVNSSCQFTEVADFAAPAGNKVVLYARDTGGKTELVARFPTGAIQQVAIEP